MPLSTVSLWLKRIGLGKRSRLEPPEPPNRYERRHPGELVHVDIKQLGRIRGAGHRVTGHRASQNPRPSDRAAAPTRLGVRPRDASTTTPASPTPRCSTGSPPTARPAFLRRAIAWYATSGVRIQAVMSDNGSGLHKPASTPDASPSSGSATSASSRTGHAPTAKPNVSSRPCSTNGHTAASTAAQPNEPHALPDYLQRYNYPRPHGSLGHQPPASRLNNLSQELTARSSVWSNARTGRRNRR